jgi:S-adenosylmethionine decarboxylase
MLLVQALADLYECDPVIEDAAVLVEAARAAAARVGATIVNESLVQYVPHGLTVAVFLAESHIVLTTWPEYRLVLVDVLLCTPEMSHEAVIDHIAGVLCPNGRTVVHHVARRIAPEPEEAGARLDRFPASNH